MDFKLLRSGLLASQKWVAGFSEMFCRLLKSGFEASQKFLGTGPNAGLLCLKKNFDIISCASGPQWPY